MKRFLLILTLGLAVVPSAQAQVTSAKVNRVAEHFRGSPVTITCNGPGFGGSAVLGGTRIYLGNAACREANQGRGVGMLVFLHELAHTLGITHETNGADCWAFSHMRPVLRKFYGFSRKKAEREYRDARAYHRSIGTLNC